MTVTDEMVERAATAIMNRRIQPNFYGVDKDNVCLFDTDKELATAALTAALSDQVMGWRPIETAPKDGRDLLLYLGTNSSDEVVIGHWSGTEPPHEDDDWYLRDSGDWIDVPCLRWQPLPAPPPVSPAVESGG